MPFAQGSKFQPLGLTLFLLFLGAAAPAWSAQPGETPPADNQPVSGPPGTTAEIAGEHTMPATVVTTDPKTGVVNVTASGMALKVHFPPPAMANLKPGDKITVHLGFTQP